MLYLFILLFVLTFPLVKWFNKETSKIHVLFEEKRYDEHHRKGIQFIWIGAWLSVQRFGSLITILVILSN